MLFSFKELKRLANLPKEITVENVINVINSIGFEVEGTEKFGDVKGVKFGKVLSVSKNPNADTLNVAKVEFEDKARTIQTNATNVVEGMYVIAFVPGSSMGDVVFNSKEMQGVVSEGMLSSLNELGADKKYLRDGMTDGIQAYPEVDLSIDPVDYLQLQDTLIDVDILSNRADAQSYYIMANELSGYFDTKMISFKENTSTFASSLEVIPSRHKELALIEAKDDIEISLREIILLNKGKVKSINNIVDLTNLTLIMTGQPTHAYDKRMIGKSFSTELHTGVVTIFGNKEVELNNDLVITSDSKPVSLSGVIGFEKTGVLRDTNEFVLELGRFNTKDIRKTLKTIKMTTPAGIQSSKILSKGITKLAIKYLSSKLKNFSNIVNFKEPSNNTIDYSTVKLSQVAGFDIVNHERYPKTIRALKILGFKFTTDMVEIPSYRSDVSSQQDINEEILRFFGYDNINPVAPKIQTLKVDVNRDIKSSIASMGYQEVYTYTLISEEKNIFNPFGFDNAIKLQTYVSKEREVLRNSQLHSMMEVIEYNLKRNFEKINLFSMGMINDGVNTISLATTTKSFNELKQDIVNLTNKDLIFKLNKDSNMHPGLSADIFFEDKKIGVIGKIHPKIWNYEALFLEIIVTDPIAKVYKTYNTDPLKKRDVTFELKERENISNYIKDIDYFEASVIDKFSKDGITKVTIRFTGSDEQIKNIDDKFNK